MSQPEYRESKVLQFLFFTVVDAVPCSYCAYSSTDLLPLINKQAHELVCTGTYVAIDWIYAFEKITNFI